jgi:hypothetical protein
MVAISNQYQENLKISKESSLQTTQQNLSMQATQ